MLGETAAMGEAAQLVSSEGGTLDARLWLPARDGLLNDEWSSPLLLTSITLKRPERLACATPSGWMDATLPLMLLKLLLLLLVTVGMLMGAQGERGVSREWGK